MAKHTKSSQGCGCSDDRKSSPCVVCDIDQMARNHYFTGKLLVERDFTEEQLYHMGKARRHNKYLHGMGVTCGLRVRQHPNQECRPQYVVIEPGTAIDCCGREIWVEHEQFLDVRALFEAWWRQQNSPDTPPDDGARDFVVCLSYAECFTEEIPALFDDCGCDETAVQPNRVQETFEFGIRPWQDPAPGDPPPSDPLDALRACWATVLADHVERCHTCDDSCVPLAVIRDYVYGEPIEDAASPNPPVWIDNGIRPLLPSTTALFELIQCLYAFIEQLDPSRGIEDLQVSFVPCDQGQSATVQDIGGVQTLVLTLHDPCTPGAGGIEDLQVSFVPCDQAQSATVQDVGGVQTLVLTLHDACATPGNGIDRVEVLDCADCAAGDEPTAAISTDASGNRVLSISFPCCPDPSNAPRAEPYVSGLSWRHDGPVDQAIFAQFGLLIAFRGPVDTTNLNRHTLQVLIENPGIINDQIPIVCWCELPGTVSGVALELDPQGDGSDRIIGVKDPNPPDPFVNGVRWQPPPGVVLPQQLTYRVVLKGDLIAGENGQSVDGNHLAPWLPQRASGDGLPGGIFESWFNFRGRISVNRATAAELTDVPGIGTELADAIIAYRESSGPYETLEKLTAVSGIATKKLEALRPHLDL